MLRIRAQSELCSLDSAYQEVEGLLRLAGGDLEATRPRISQWSVTQHIHHIFLVNDAVLRNIGRLLSPGDEKVLPGGHPSTLGYLVLVTKWIPRGRGKAPLTVIPPPSSSPDELADLLYQSNRGWTDVAAQSGELARRRGRIHHFVFGDLNALQWLRFARIHTRHHLRIIEDIRKG